MAAASRLALVVGELASRYGPPREPPRDPLELLLLENVALSRE